MSKKSLLFSVFVTIAVAKVLACTSFGFLTETGTVIAKNSDYYYDKQKVEVLVPNKQFAIWYDNTYNNDFKVFAQMANNNVKMGINEVGLTAMEEDPILVKNLAPLLLFFGSEPCLTTQAVNAITIMEKIIADSTYIFIFSPYRL